MCAIQNKNNAQRANIDMLFGAIMSNTMRNRMIVRLNILI